MLRLTSVRSLTASWRVLLAGSLAGLAVVVLATVNPLRFFETVSYTHLTLPTKRIV